MTNCRINRNKRKSEAVEDSLALGNHLTLEELSAIEEMAHRSHSHEADAILRLSAALREAMQVRENAFALVFSGVMEKRRAKTDS